MRYAAGGSRQDAGIEQKSLAFRQKFLCQSVCVFLQGEPEDGARTVGEEKALAEVSIQTQAFVFGATFLSGRGRESVKTALNSADARSLFLGACGTRSRAAGRDGSDTPRAGR